MLIKRAVLDRIAAGEVTLAFRRWQRPTVRAGGRLRTAIGELAIDAVDAVDAVDAIEEAEARRAGYASRAALLADLGARDGRLYRIALRLAGADARVGLRQREAITRNELAQIRRRLAVLDQTGAWTLEALRLVARHPGRRAADLAAMLGRDKPVFKRNMRRLKELGLTESLEVGYRLSPRGRTVLAQLSAPAD